MEASELKNQFLHSLELKNYDQFERRLLRLREQRMLPPVILLEGPKGIGKSLAVLKVSSLMLCESLKMDSEQVSPCGECQSCLALRVGKHPDHLYLDSTEDTGVELAKRVQKFVEFGPENDIKLLNLVDCDSLNASAVNRLLKTLEEPNPNIIFLLTTSRLQALLPTLRSRCVEWPAPVFPKQLTREIVESELFRANRTCAPEKLDMLVDRFYRSPGSCLEGLDRDEVIGIQEMCRKVVQASSLKELAQVSKWAAAYTKTSIYALLNELEYALNQEYRSNKQALQFGKLKKRRTILRRVRRLVKTNQNLALNNTLLLESVASTQLPGS